MQCGERLVRQVSLWSGDVLVSLDPVSCPHLGMLITTNTFGSGGAAIYCQRVLVTSGFNVSYNIRIATITGPGEPVAPCVATSCALCSNCESPLPRRSLCSRRYLPRLLSVTKRDRGAPVVLCSSSQCWRCRLLYGRHPCCPSAYHLWGHDDLCRRLFDGFCWTDR